MARYINADRFVFEVTQLPGDVFLEKQILDIVDKIPTADVRAGPHGKWVEKPQADGLNGCSICGIMRFGESNYCPNCGARMDQ